MVFGSLYYQGFAKKHDKHGKDSAKDGPPPSKTEGLKDAEKGSVEEVTTPLLTKADAK